MFACEQEGSIIQAQIHFPYISSPIANMRSALTSEAEHSGSWWELLLSFVFVFQNLYNPGSPYFTQFVNLLMLVVLMLLPQKMEVRLRYAGFVIGVVFLILLWAMALTFFRSYSDPEVLLKYSRNAISVLFIVALSRKLHLDARQANNIIGVVFFFHLASIPLQWLWPSIEAPMAKIFGFTRDFDIVSNLTNRKLGITGGYDTASEFSVGSMIFFYIRHLYTPKILFILLSAISFGASFASSRLGMLLACASLAVIIGHTLFLSKRSVPVRFLVLLVSGFTGAYVAYLFAPLFARSFGFSAVNEDSAFFGGFFDSYGSRGTVDALTADHLDPLQVSLGDLIFGFGVDPYKLTGMGSDIGYVKLIYHVGIIGLLVILLLYGYISYKCYKTRRVLKGDREKMALSLFVISFIIVDVVMNYKALVLYSRGSFELVLIAFFFSTRVVYSRVPIVFSKVAPVVRGSKASIQAPLS